MRRRYSLNLRWSRVLAASFLCLAGVALAGFGVGLWVGDDSEEVASLTDEISSLRAQLDQRDTQPSYAIPTFFADPVTAPISISGSVDVTEPVDSAAFLGVAGHSVDATGVEITSVIEGTAAERAGLRNGDLVKEFDGESVTSFEALRRAIQSRAIGETVDLTIERHGSEIHLTATLGSSR